MSGRLWLGSLSGQPNLCAVSRRRRWRGGGGGGGGGGGKGGGEQWRAWRVAAKAKSRPGAGAQSHPVASEGLSCVVHWRCMAPSVPPVWHSALCMAPPSVWHTAKLLSARLTGWFAAGAVEGPSSFQAFPPRDRDSPALCSQTNQPTTTHIAAQVNHLLHPLPLPSPINTHQKWEI